MKGSLNTVFVFGDDRTLFAISYCASLGMEVAAFGSWENIPPEAVRMTCLEDCFEFGDQVILPIPVTRDGVFLTGSNIYLSEIKKLCERYGDKTKVFGAMPPKELDGMVIDYMAEEKYQSASASLTRDAFFEYLSRENKSILDTETVCVCGYGRIGRELCNTLRKLKIRVKVLTATPEKHRKSEGIEFYHYNSAKKAFEGVTRVINTAPCNVISEDAVLSMAENAVYYELASKPFGISEEAKRSLADRRVLLSGLPGKFFPKESGMLIVDTVMELLGKIP